MAVAVAAWRAMVVAAVAGTAVHMVAVQPCLRQLALDLTRHHRIWQQPLRHHRIWQQPLRHHRI
jgi:hypothetical protein